MAGYQAIFCAVLGCYLSGQIISNVREVHKNGGIILNEKEAIEKATADAFVELYNSETGSFFSIIEYSDAPDIRCQDPEGNKFSFEITLTEDRPKDIQAILGRSDHKSLNSLKKHLEDVKAGKANPFEKASFQEGNVIEMIVSRINPKLKKDYGSNVALVVRDVSPLDWDWDIVINQIKAKINLERNPFDKGIWIITYSKDRIYKIL